MSNNYRIDNVADGRRQTPPEQNPEVAKNNDAKGKAAGTDRVKSREQPGTDGRRQTPPEQNPEVAKNDDNIDKPQDMK